MYCDKCKHQSPDNFTNCAYCGERLKVSEKKKENKASVFSKLSFLNKKSAVLSLLCIALAVALICGVVGFFAGKKPAEIAVDMAKAIEENDAELYFSLFDKEYLDYKKEYIYFTDDELFKGITEPLYESDGFYKKECGENYTLKVKTENVKELTFSEIEQVNTYLSQMYGYKDVIKEAAVLDFTITAKGEKGEYKSDYRNFYCIKTGNRWYRSPELDSMSE